MRRPLSKSQSVCIVLLWAPGWNDGFLQRACFPPLPLVPALGVRHFLDKAEWEWL